MGSLDEPTGEAAWRGRVRHLLYPVQFDAEPEEGVNRVMALAMASPHTTPEEYLVAVREGLASAVDLSTLLPMRHDAATLRCFLAALERRLADEVARPPQPSTDPLAVAQAILNQPVLEAGTNFMQRWRGVYRGQAAVVRVARFETSEWPVVNPIEVFEHAASLFAKLQLTSTAAPLACGSGRTGVYAIEAWCPGTSLVAKAPASWQQTRAWLLPVAEDLLRLRQGHQYHGGVRPSRVCVGPLGSWLVGFSWAFWQLLLAPEQRGRLMRSESGARAFASPELLRDGARAAGPDTDIFSLAQTITYAVSAGLGPLPTAGIPIRAREVIDAARAPSLVQRPPLRELVAALRE